MSCSTSASKIGVDVVAEGYDLALRVTTDHIPGDLIARRLGPVPSVIAASADYLKRRGVPKSPEDLADHDCLIVGKEHSWRFTGPHGVLEVPARVVLRFRSMNVGVAHAACAGVGLALLPCVMFEEPMFRGKLRSVLSDYPLGQPNLYAIYVSRRHVPPKIRTFVDHVAAHMARARLRPPDVEAPEIGPIHARVAPIQMNWTRIPHMPSMITVATIPATTALPTMNRSANALLTPCARMTARAPAARCARTKNTPSQ
jgi:hypothetical protein